MLSAHQVRSQQLSEMSAGQTRHARIGLTGGAPNLAKGGGTNGFGDKQSKRQRIGTSLSHRGRLNGYDNHGIRDKVLSNFL